ncbi:MAG: AAA family ATPase [Pacificimonas sp.]|jgi:predicted ATPase|nr:AAA family ATPase [Pacificimonas sp.]
MKPVVISGCSGGGKSTLIAELARRGYRTSAEIGRAVVAAGEADPAANPGYFAALVAAREIKRALDEENLGEGPTFFDRSLIDQIAFAARTGSALPGELGAVAPGDFYHQTVFFTPPWPEIFVQDTERRHDLAEAMAEYVDLHRIYPRFGYRVIDIPRGDVKARASFVLETLGLA